MFKRMADAVAEKIETHWSLCFPRTTVNENFSRILSTIQNVTDVLRQTQQF